MANRLTTNKEGLTASGVTIEGVNVPLDAIKGMSAFLEKVVARDNKLLLEGEVLEEVEKDITITSTDINYNYTFTYSSVIENGDIIYSAVYVRTETARELEARRVAPVTPTVLDSFEGSTLMEAETARDQFFSSNPSLLVEGLQVILIVAGSPSTRYISTYTTFLSGSWTTRVVVG